MRRPVAIVVVMVMVLSLVGSVVFAFASPTPRYSVAELQQVKTAIETDAFPRVSGTCGYSQVRSVRIDQDEGVVKVEARDDAARNIVSAFDDRVEVSTEGAWTAIACF